MSLPGQMSLLDWHPPRARRSDPATSHAAAEHAEQFLGQHQSQILTVLRAAGRPLAAEEIADRIGWPTLHAAARRLPELVGGGLIEVVEGETHENRSGRKAQRYRMVAI